MDVVTTAGGGGKNIREVHQMSELKVPKILVINLKHRKDRLESITKELQRMGLDDQMEVVEGHLFKTNGTGTAGVAFSHKHAVRLAKECGYEMVMILQDDCKFLVDRGEFITQINSFIEAAKDEPWTGLWFGSFFQADFGEGDSYAKPIRFNQDTATLIHSRGYDTFIDYFGYCAITYATTGEDVYNIDQFMFEAEHGSKKEQSFANVREGVRVLRKKLCGQADDYSDRLFVQMQGGIGKPL